MYIFYFIERFSLFFYLYILVYDIVFICLTVWLAKQKGRDALSWSLLAFFFGVLAIIPLGFSPSLKNENSNDQSCNNINNDILNIISEKLEELIKLQKQQVQNQEKSSGTNPTLNSRIIELLNEGKSEADAKKQAEAEMFVKKVRAEEEENNRKADEKKALLAKFSYFNKMLEDENIRNKAKDIKRLYGKSAAIDFLKNEAKNNGVENLEIPNDFVL